VRRADALPLLAFFGIVLPLLLGMFSLPVLGIVRILTLLRRLVLMAVLVILPTLLILSFAHRGTPSSRQDDFGGETLQAKIAGGYSRRVQRWLPTGILIA
jgi:hypothetical protein